MKESSLSILDKIHVAILEAEFNRRKQLNSKYSMRAFATDANVHNGTMSAYLTGKRKLTVYSFELILSALQVENEILSQYKKEVEGLKLIKEKHHLVRTNWYYFAILELINTIGFKSDPTWIAKKLKISEEVAVNAVKDLIEIGGITLDSNKNYVDSLGTVTFVEDLDMDIISGRVYQKQLIEKAIYSIENEDAKIKDHTSICFAFDTRLTPKVKQKIKNFRDDLIEYIQTDSIENDSVFSIQINFNKLSE